LKGVQQKLEEIGFEDIIVSDTIDIPDWQTGKKIKIVSIAKKIANSLRNNNNE